MDSNKPKTSAKDFFLNLGAIVALYTLLYSLFSLLSTVIDYAFPPTQANYYFSTSISWPVATLVIFYPIFILLMWLLAREYKTEPERQSAGIHKWLTYITLFISGLTMAGDLITVLYKFIDGQDLTTGFLLKVLVLLVMAGGVFAYYISDATGKLTSKSRMIWRAVSGVLVIGSIVWGFVVLGSPASQRLAKYDEQKVSDLQNLNQSVISYYQVNSSLPGSIADLTKSGNYFVPVDPQTNQPYEYVLVGQSAKAYQLCAEFNKASNSANKSVPVVYPGSTSWNHPAGHYCFAQTIPASAYPGKLPM